MKQTAEQTREIVETYMADCLAGRIAVCKLTRCAIERHQRDLQDAGSRGFHFDEDAATHAVNFFPLFHHQTGEFQGKPFILEPWQQFMVWVLFGWRKADGLRRFRTAFLTMGRGNGKTPFGAAVALLLWAADSPREPRAEVVCAATKKKQARKTWDEAKRFLASVPSINVEYADSTLGTCMRLPANGSTFEVMEYSSAGDDGQNLHGAIVDELHAFQDRHQKLIDNIETALNKRRQPLLIYITTAGDDRSDIWFREYEHAARVAEGVMPADDYFALIYQIDDDDDPLEESNWEKANPNLGISVKLDGLRSMANKAAGCPEALRKLRRYHLNVKTTSLTRAITPEMWATGDSPLPELNGMRCHGGLDLGWSDDLAALGRVFPLDKDKRGKRIWAVNCDIFLPKGGRRQIDKSPWREWIDAGLITATEGNTTDPEAIYKAAEESKRIYDLQTVALDPNNARAVGIHLVNKLDIKVFEMFQTKRKYNEPLKEFLEALHDGRIIHGGNPLLKWCASNVITETDAAGCSMPAKAKSSEKIDPIVAIIMALSECLFAEQVSAGAYDQPGGSVLF